MKKTLMLLSAAAIMYSCQQTETATEAEATATAEETVTTEGQHFGAAFAEQDVLPAAELSSALSGKDSLQATVRAEVMQSCQAKGCWMDVKLADNSDMKVTFRDYGFFLPVENLEGREVVFTGTARRELISVEDQRHFAQDAGKSAEEIAAITEPREELRFVADGVILK